MIPVIDTHTHLDFSDFDPDRAAVIERAQQAGVARMLLIATRPATLERVTGLCAQYPVLVPVLGYHPGNVDEVTPGDLDRLRDVCRSHPVAALGECGLDYHRPPENLPGEDATAHGQRLEDWKIRQKELFRSQLDLAVELGLNVVVHQRDSWDDCLAILRGYTGRLRAVFHCFGGTLEQARTLRDLGHLVSFTGIVTFKNAAAAQAAAAGVDEAGFMVETDCPYLAPVPHRGKRCEPAFTREVVQHIARLRGVGEDDIARITNRVAADFFRLP
ncbi:MAG: TatD family hydrolase [Candidatus Methylacidiphilales bacterium]|nr:TatD family hydrolase [Candidatus Methylacidiphilales bacterium]